MNIPTYKDQAEFVESSLAADKTEKIDTEDPHKLAVGSDASLAAIVQSFIASQSQTNHQLIEYIGHAVASTSDDVRIGNLTLNNQNQQNFLSEIAARQNLFSRQLEKNLQQQIILQSGGNIQPEAHLINVPPSEWGQQEKVSDSSIKLINEFSGDSSDNEQALSIFLRGIFALAKTSDLTEKTAVNVLFRKLTGSAYILTDQFLQNEKNASIAQVIRLLENKFLAHCSPLAAESALHGLQIGSMTFVQLQAKCTKLAFMATRMEAPATREAIRKLKETNAFLMAISTQDRVAIHNENQRRATHNLASLSLDQMTDMLQNLYSEKASYAQNPILAVNTDAQPVTNVTAKPAKYKQPRYAKNAGQGERRGSKQNGKKLITPQDVKVEHNACLLCGSLSHTYQQDICPYYNTPLMRSECKVCYKGGHRTALCKSKPKPQHRRM